MIRGSHEAGTVMNGISILISVMRELASSLCSPPCEDTISHHSRKGTSPESNQAGTLIADFQAPDL